MLKIIDRILANAGDREAFFNRISQIYPTRDPSYRLIKRAYDTCKDAFRDMLREDQTRYFEHLRAVTLIQLDYLYIRDAQTLAEGMMHDLPEDKLEWPLARIEDTFSEFERYFDEWTLPLDLEYLKKPSLSEFGTKELCLQVYHDRLMIAPRRVLLSKLPDRLHNLRTMWACSKEKRKRKIEETERIYVPLARSEIILVHEIEAAIVELKIDALK